MGTSGTTSSRCRKRRALSDWGKDDATPRTSRLAFKSQHLGVFVLQASYWEDPWQRAASQWPAWEDL